MKITRYLVIFFLIFSVFPTFAQDKTSKTKANFYITSSVGLPIFYDLSLSVDYNSTQDYHKTSWSLFHHTESILLDGSSSDTVYLDTSDPFKIFYANLSFGFAVNKHILVNFSMRGIFDNLTTSKSVTFLYSAGMYYFLNQVGDGLYLRGDIGAVIGWGLPLHTNTELAFGSEAGFGYAVKLSESFSLTTGLAYKFFYFPNISRNRWNPGIPGDVEDSGHGRLHSVQMQVGFILGL